MIPTFHAVTSALLEVAVALGSGDSELTTEDAVGDADAGSDFLEYPVPRNASHLESGGTVDGWGISNAQLTKGSIAWEACRYYEVGDIQAGVQQVIYEAALGEKTTGYN